jgi:hypothetical protein
MSFSMWVHPEGRFGRSSVGGVAGGEGGCLVGVSVIVGVDFLDGLNNFSSDEVFVGVAFLVGVNNFAGVEDFADVEALAGDANFASEGTVMVDNFVQES